MIFPYRYDIIYLDDLSVIFEHNGGDSATVKLGGTMENKIQYLTPEVVLEPVDSTMLLSVSEEDAWTGNY